MTYTTTEVTEMMRECLGELKSELLKRMMRYDSKDGYSQIHDEIIQKVYEDVETILLSFRKKKLSALIEQEK